MHCKQLSRGCLQKAAVIPACPRLSLPPARPLPPLPFRRESLSFDRKQAPVIHDRAVSARKVAISKQSGAVDYMRKTIGSSDRKRSTHSFPRARPSAFFLASSGRLRNAPNRINYVHLRPFGSNRKKPERRNESRNPLVRSSRRAGGKNGLSGGRLAQGEEIVNKTTSNCSVRRLVASIDRSK